MVRRAALRRRAKSHGIKPPRREHREPPAPHTHTHTHARARARFCPVGDCAPTPSQPPITQPRPPAGGCWRELTRSYRSTGPAMSPPLPRSPAPGPTPDGVVTGKKPKGASGSNRSVTDRKQAPKRLGPCRRRAWAMDCFAFDPEHERVRPRAGERAGGRAGRRVEVSGKNTRRRNSSRGVRRAGETGGLSNSWCGKHTAGLDARGGGDGTWF